MILWSTLSLALQSIRRNAARSLLTALGVVIGVASVITMVNLGQAAGQQVASQISSMGPNLLFVRPGTMGSFMGGPRAPAVPFELGDAAAITEQVDGVLVAPASTTSATVAFGNFNATTTILGTTLEYFSVRNLELAAGRTFEPRELESGAPVCLLGPTVVENLYPHGEPLGTTMRLGATACQVIGVLASKGSNMGVDQDDTVLMPIRAVHNRLTGSRDVSTIYVSAIEDGTSARVGADIVRVLRARRHLHEGEPNDFDVRDMAELASTLQNTTRTMTALLGAIAAVSLLVGGIGIMNIMLVSVTERTREIGLRLALGARSGEIRLQFLVEAVVLSVGGGLVGVLLGLLATWVLTAQLAMPLVIAPEMVVAAFACSSAIGMLFGWLPAQRASRLDPIVALRHE